MRKNCVTMSVLEWYYVEIRSALKDIDIYMREKEGDAVPLNKASELLRIGMCEIKALLNDLDARVITKKTFFEIMRRGSSDVCGLYAREVECGSPFVYTPEQVSYIYGADKEDVSYAFGKLHIKIATEYTLPIILGLIHVK